MIRVNEFYSILVERKRLNYYYYFPTIREQFVNDLANAESPKAQ